ncbi:MAG: hypothetical protein MUC99_11340 [Anaerolineae bacterium]|jgi:hypothetical protein|nr:hypothetical protein [Anaerolineae bacterium]
MRELIDRYVHQVGLYVRPKERADIEAELRSQIQDQLDDRYGATPTRDEVAAVLKQLGDPRTMAASYGGEQYLIGPTLYPFFQTVMRFGLVLVPVVVMVVQLVEAALSEGSTNWVGLLVGVVLNALQAVAIFFAVVVGIFWAVQRSGEVVHEAAEKGFDPLKLPPVEEPTMVNRLEAGLGIASGTVVGLAFLYCASVGGLTLRFGQLEPSDVLPAPTGWLLFLGVTTLGVVLLTVLALAQRRWTVWTWGVQTVLDLIGAIGLYFALFTPLADRLRESVPDLPIGQAPLVITLSMIVVIVLVNGAKLIQLVQRRQAASR